MKKKVENARRFGSNRHIEFGGAVYSAAKTAAAVSSWLVPTIVSTPLPINFTRTGTTVIGLEIIFVARTPPRFGPRIVFNYQLHPLPQLYAIQHRVQLLFLWPWFRVDAACFSNNCAENESEGGREEGRECVSLSSEKNNGFDARLAIGELRGILSSMVEKIRGETRIDWKE